MEAVATRAQSPQFRRSKRLSSPGLSVWVLVGALVVYLALAGGGYALPVHAQVGIAVWWLVVVGAVFGLLPVARPSGPAVIVLALLAAFVAWTAIANTWSISPGRSLDDLALVTCYLGIFVLAVFIHRERGEAMKHTINATATAITVVAGLAVASRLWPHLIAGGDQTASFLGGTRARLSWPLNYWNALAALVVLGFPLLLSVATSARTLLAQAAAAAAIPLVALCAALTLSRGGLIAGAVAVMTFVALTRDRISTLATVLVTAAGSAILIDGAFNRHALQQGLVTPAAGHEGRSLFLAVMLTCVGVGVVQTAIGIAMRHGTPPRWLTISPRQARALLGIGAALALALAIAAGAPSRLDHAWQAFKTPVMTASGTSVSRFGSTSGNGRYQYWSAAVHSTRGHVLDGAGPGTFQLLWLPRAPFKSYVVNAHSLYMETLAELGVVGLAILLTLFVALLGFAITQVIKSRYEDRTRAAAIFAALLAFMVSAAFDWVWQVPVIPSVVLLLAAAILAPSRARTSDPPSDRLGVVLPLRAMTGIAGIAAIIAISFPLATSNALSQSQAAAANGNVLAALAAARQAVALEPSDAAAQLQLALVLEMGGAYKQAVAAAERAVAVERQNWSSWLVLARLQTEAGNPTEAVTAYRQARSLNPHSPIFAR